MIEVVVPKWGLTVDEATVSAVLCAVGDRVVVDQPLFEADTDKVTSEVPSPADGVITEIKFGEGDRVEPGWVIAVIDPNE